MQVRQFVKMLLKLGQMLVLVIAFFDFSLGRIDALLQRIGGCLLYTSPSPRD